MKILILDDMDERHEGFKKILFGHNLKHVKTYRDAIWAMRQEKFDMACLDHDLEDFDSDGPEYTGVDVCYWLKGCGKDFCPPKILIHSHNPVGSNNMRLILNDIPNIEVTVKPYSIRISFLQR